MTSSKLSNYESVKLRKAHAKHKAFCTNAGFEKQMRMECKEFSKAKEKLKAKIRNER